MKATIYIIGSIKSGETLKDVVRQFKAHEAPSEVEVVIDSEGGNVTEGESVYNYLKTLDAEIPVTTIAKKAYSIAAKIFASGSTRKVSDSEKALMIHFPWIDPKGIAMKAEDFEEFGKALRDLEKNFTAFYSEFLGIDKETVTNLLDNETFISGAEALDLGFATEIEAEVAAVAEYSIENSNNNKMTETKKSGFLEKAKKAALDFLAMLEDPKMFAKSELLLQDSTGMEIVFPDLESADVPKVGDKATLDGKPVDGTYIMPSLDNSTVVFVGGVVDSITEAETEETTEETETETASNEANAEKKPEVNAEEVKQINVWSMEVVNTSFAVGDTVKYKNWEDIEQTIGAGEFQLNDGRRIVTDASGVIVAIKETGQEKTVETETTTETATEASLAELVEKATKEALTEINAKLQAKETELNSLKRKVGSKEFKAETAEPTETPKRKKTMVEILCTKE